MRPEPEPPRPLQPAVEVPEVPVELPESYGTERLFLTARDPHWLHAAWDLAPARQMPLNRMSRDGHLVVRAHVADARGPVASEAHVHPESKSWFVHVPDAGTQYTAELGYYDSGGEWHTIASSDSAVTPPDTSSETEAVEFVTVPPEVPLEKIFEAVQEAVAESVPLIEAVSQSLPSAEPIRPQPVEQKSQAPRPAEQPADRPVAKWSPARAHALAEIVRVDDSRRVWIGSLEVTEMVRRHLKHEITSPAPVMEAAEAAAAPTGPAPAEVSSAAAVPQQEEAQWERGFWFNLNAELVLYGATEPDAKVTVDGRQIRLRPDGTFSYRFALPDGRYPLTIAADAVDGSDRKSAKLEFSRTTSFDGAGVHAQDAELKLPAASNMT